ncbi:MAG TPA: 50S ribosomal protein L30 [Gammaproteobacteria bacterium]|nr:50S ribosomal protein L30 [Gammaproteobacteria bacterium]
MVRQKKKQIRVTLIRSTIEALKAHKDCVRGLGLRRLRHSVILEDTVCIRGMINRVQHLLTVEEV